MFRANTFILEKGGGEDWAVMATHWQMTERQRALRVCLLMVVLLQPFCHRARCAYGQRRLFRGSKIHRGLLDPSASKRLLRRISAWESHLSTHMRCHVVVPETRMID